VVVWWRGAVLREHRTEVTDATKDGEGTWLGSGLVEVVLVAWIDFKKASHRGHGRHRGWRGDLVGKWFLETEFRRCRRKNLENARVLLTVPIFSVPLWPP
jgi:hypothetical protein